MAFPHDVRCAGSGFFSECINKFLELTFSAAQRIEDGVQFVVRDCKVFHVVPSFLSVGCGSSVTDHRGSRHRVQPLPRRRSSGKSRRRRCILLLPDCLRCGRPARRRRSPSPRPQARTFPRAGRSQRRRRGAARRGAAVSPRVFARPEAAAVYSFSASMRPAAYCAGSSRRAHTPRRRLLPVRAGTRAAPPNGLARTSLRESAPILRPVLCA